MRLLLTFTGIPALLCLTSVAVAVQNQPPVVPAFHPSGPMPSYEVATIKPVDPGQRFGGTTIRHYIADAFGVPIPWGVPSVEYPGAQVLGGPSWIDKDRYEIKGKIPDELRQERQKMSKSDRDAQTEMMEQSLLAERFHLKVHFETREMSIFELVPAKGGLKIKPAAPVADNAGASRTSHDSMSPGSMGMNVMLNGTTILQGRSVPLKLFLNALRGESPDVAGRPIVDMTGFQGNFDLKDFRFAGLPLPGANGSGVTAGDQDIPPLSQALEQQLGLRLIPAKGQVEVIVIDSIDRPTDN